MHEEIASAMWMKTLDQCSEFYWINHKSTAIQLNFCGKHTFSEIFWFISLCWSIFQICSIVQEDVLLTTSSPTCERILGLLCTSRCRSARVYGRSWALI